MVTLPEQFERQMSDVLGNEYPSFANALNGRAPVSIRINPHKRTGIVEERQVPWSRYGRYLETRPVFTLDPVFHAGGYYVQEASSMFLEQAFSQHVSLDRPLTVLDLCAAPGGKSTHLLSLLHSDSLLVSNEVIRSRVGSLTENIQKWGYPNCVITSNDAEDFQNLPGLFDVVVVDAPCSGEGMFRKDPEARNEWSPDNIAICSARQKRILDSVWPAVKQDGILIYSTCTFNKQENEENLLWLSSQHDVEFLRIETDASWSIDEVVEGPVFGYRFYPHKAIGEGFFIAVVKKNQPQEGVSIRRHSRDNFIPPSKKISAEIGSWLKPGEHAFIQRDEIIQVLPQRWQQTIFALTKQLRVIYAGTYLAVQKHEKLVPEHSLALSIILSDEHFSRITVAEDEALAYLRKETLGLAPPFRGFALITINNLALGWVNIVPGRLNNLYPSGWRIRMA